MADARAKMVMDALADLYTRANYIIDRVNDVGPAVGFGDTIEIPDVSAFSVKPDASTRSAASAVTTNVLSLAVNRHPGLNLAIPKPDRFQLLNGNWAGQVGLSAATQLKNYMDRDLFDYVNQTLNYDATATYHVNVAGNSLTEDDILTAKAKIMQNEGAHRPILIMNPYGMASLQSISGFVPAFSAAEQGQLGIPQVGSVFGVPVYESQSVRTGRTLASTAWAISSNVLTVTVAAGHGLVPGQLVTFDTVTAGGDMSTPTAITSVTATTIVIDHTASNGSATEAGTVTVESAENVMIDLENLWVAQSIMPSIRIVPDYDSSNDALQVDALWGRIGRAGRHVTLHSPKASA